MASSDWCLFFTFCGVFGLTYVFKTDQTLFLHYVAQILLGLGALSFAIYWLDRKGAFKYFQKRQKTENTCSGFSQDVIRKRQQSVRKQLQEKYSQVTDEYNEKVLRPRKEAKRKAAEDELYRFSGPAWKGRSDKLGSEDGAETHPTCGTGRDAAQSRHLPEHIENPPKPPKKEIRKKKVISLPPEPPVGDPESIAISLRTPLGNIHRRRFLKTDFMQTLLDYMTLLGYNQKKYCISTSYPRQVISTHTSQSLLDVGLVHDIYLNVEEIELDSE